MEEKCFLCGSKKYHIIHHGVRGNADIDVFKCDECGLVRLSDFIENTDEFYKNSGMRRLNDEDMKEILVKASTDDERRYQYTKGMIENKSVLDFGCGAGGYLTRAQKIAKNVAGVEPEQVMNDMINAKKIKCYHDISEVEEGTKFDVITMFHVLEHLATPQKYLINIKKYLKGGDGRIVIEVPNADDALLSLYENEKFADFTYWECHLFLYTNETLKKLLHSVGLKPVFMEQIQRYPLANHLFWLSQGKPGGHMKWKALVDDRLDKLYGDKLAKLGIADTILAIAKVDS